MKTIDIILLAVALLVAAFLIGRCSAPQEAPEPHVVERVDTLYIRDTITREKPVYRTKYVSVTDSVRVVVRDTVVVSLPREMSVYEDSLYRAEVSGIEPSLDRIEIYAPTRVVTRTETRDIFVTSRKRYGIGIQVGYGVGFYNGIVHTSPYIGVGMSYNILTF